MSPCAVCPTESIGAGRFPFLCIPHALAVASVDAMPIAPFTALEIAAGATRWRDLSRTTRHQGSARIPAPDPDARDADDPARLAAAVEVMRSLGGVALRTERTYGEPCEGVSGPRGITARMYPPKPSHAVSVDPGAPGVPRAANAMAKVATTAGWSVKLRAVYTVEPQSVVLRAWRGSLLVVASWTEGKFTSAWAARGRDLPIALGARQATALLKARIG